MDHVGVSCRLSMLKIISKKREITPKAACWRLLAFLFVLLALLFLVTRVRAYETDVRCLLRLADHVVKHLVDYVLSGSSSPPGA